MADELKRFLTDILDEDALHTIRVAPRQKKVLVNSPDTFQTIAYHATIDSILVAGNRVYFAHDLNGEKTQAWAYELTQGTNYFLETYGNQYLHL
ncbi:MAG: hypothetical protein R6V53_03875 [Candidatus Woesearchaeota archaeon]